MEKILELRQEINSMKHDIIVLMAKQGVFEDDGILSVYTEVAPYMDRICHMCDLCIDIMIAQASERKEMNNKLNKVLEVLTNKD